MADKRLGTPEKFWAKVRKTRGCWLWTGWQNRGYGMVHRIGKDQLAHRFSWLMEFGRIPKGMYVCHRCDVKNCVRPSHLFLGTQLDNMHDMWRKGREGNRARGSRTGTSKLKERDIPQIRDMRIRKIKFKKIADKFNVSIATIEKIVYGEHWRHA